MSDEQRSWTLDDSSRASNPGNLRVNPLRWIRFYPLWPAIWFGILLLFVLLACLVHWGFWVPAALLLLMNAFYWLRVREHFRCGCANPGIVVSLDPMLIAVATDLTKGFGSFPAIKIIHKSLPTVSGRAPQMGAPLVAVALYSQGEDPQLPHWVDFDPRPIDCVTGDPAAIQRSLSSISPGDWNDLQVWLTHVPRPFQPGLYHIQQNAW